MRRFLTLMASVLFGCASLSLHGCGGNNIQVEMNGMDWAGGGRSGIITVGDLEGYAKVVMNGVALEIKGGRISLDGKDRGPVQKGDRVVVKADGQLYVNQEKR